MAVGVIIAGMGFRISGGEKKGETIAANMEFDSKDTRELTSSSASQSNLRGGAVCILMRDTALRLLVVRGLRLGVVVQRPARVDDVHGDADRDGHGRPLELRDSVGEAAHPVAGRPTGPHAPWRRLVVVVRLVEDLDLEGLHAALEALSVVLDGREPTRASLRRVFKAAAGTAG